MWLNDSVVILVFYDACWCICVLDVYVPHLYLTIQCLATKWHILSESECSMKGILADQCEQVTLFKLHTRVGDMQERVISTMNSTSKY